MRHTRSQNSIVTLGVGSGSGAAMSEVTAGGGFVDEGTSQLPVVQSCCSSMSEPRRAPQPAEWLMRETIYLQAGPVANFIGSHFFSTQFAYYPEDADDDPTSEEGLAENVARAVHGHRPQDEHRNGPVMKC